MLVLLKKGFVSFKIYTANLCVMDMDVKNSLWNLKKKSRKINTKLNESISSNEKW